MPRLIILLWASAMVACSASPSSGPPTDDELVRAGVFEEPLLPVGATTPDENRALGEALASYRAAVQESGARDAVDAVTAFLEAHPRSAWTPALLLNLGVVYRRTGHFTRAIAAWQRAWALTRDLDAPDARTIADASAANLSQFEAYLGRKEELEPLLAELNRRPLRGTAAELVSESVRGLAEMKSRPEASFKCGPFALYRIDRYRRHGQSDAALVQAIDAARSTPTGMSLTAVRELSERVGMSYQMAFRTAGAQVVWPAVVHWKVGHFAALVDRVEGRYLVEDSTFGENIRVSPEALDEEASGYFLIPPGALPSGWRAVSPEEGARVWGRGTTGDNHDNGDTGSCANAAFPCGCPKGGCTTWNVQSLGVGLELDDTPLGYAPPVGPPVKLGMVYAQRDAQQPMAFTYTNFGNKWTTTWLSYVTDDINVNSTAILYGRGGGAETYTITNGAVSDPGPFTQALLIRHTSGGATSGFTRRLSSGATEEFTQALGNRWFMTAVADPQGNRATIAYDAMARITSITDSLGQVTTFTYGLAADPLKVTQVTDPFGRSAQFAYDAGGHLVSMTDVLGITSQYTYGPGDFVNTLTTPYGTTRFTYGDLSTNPVPGAIRWVQITDALGRTSRVQNTEGAVPTSDPPATVPSLPANFWLNINLTDRNTFIWSPTQWTAANTSVGIDYSKAKVIHWLHTPDMTSSARVMESVKEPLENRVWFQYANQTTSYVLPGASNQPIAIARVLDDGTTQLTKFQYDALGNVTGYSDPIGRQFTLTYQNQIDVTSIANTTGGANQVLVQRSYNLQHEPISITDAAGQTTQVTYNAAGQPTVVTDALGRSTTYQYDSHGYLEGIQGPLAAASWTFTHDNVGRLASASDPSGATVTYAYDAADRPTAIGFPDGTDSQLSYHLLDLASTTDRLGQSTSFTYDAERQLTQITDALNHTVELGYCDCGGLASIVDQRGNRTTFVRDLQGRVIGHAYPDAKGQSIAYDASGRVHSIADAMKQKTVFSYYADDTLAGIQYANLLGASLPPVSFTYDASWARLTSTTDANGTTALDYHPVGVLGANRLAQVTSPIAGGSAMDTVSYTYDALGRAIGQTVDGVAEARGFDELGRLTTVKNALDTFDYSYADGTARVAGVGSLHGLKTALSYYGPKGDALLSAISYSGPAGNPLAQFAYTYDADDRVTRLTQTYFSDPFALLHRRARSRYAALPLVLLIASLLLFRRRAAWRRWALFAFLVVVGCSDSGQPATPPDAPVPDASVFDAAGFDGATPSRVIATDYAYDAVNRVLSAATTGATLSQYAYAYDESSNLASMAANGTATSLTYNQLNQLIGPAPAAYDANGSPQTLGDAQYVWDGANRLSSIIKSSHQTDFTYDGLDRLVRIVEKESGATVADHAYLWCGAERCLERDNTQTNSPITKRYFSQGVQLAGQPYYYVTDQQHSIRQLVDGSGKVRAQYEYDPYGNRTKTGGDLESDFGYAGYLHHEASGLELTVMRAYSPALGKWLNRDPIAEAGGLNQYEYVNSQPVNRVDPLGMKGGDALPSWLDVTSPWGLYGQVGVPAYTVAGFAGYLGTSGAAGAAAALGATKVSTILGGSAVAYGWGGGGLAGLSAAGSALAVPFAGVAAAATGGWYLGRAIDKADDWMLDKFGMSPLMGTKAALNGWGQEFWNWYDGEGDPNGRGKGFSKPQWTPNTFDEYIRRRGRNAPPNPCPGEMKDALNK